MYSTLTIRIPAWLDKFLALPVIKFRKWKHGYPYRRIYVGEDQYAIVDPQDYYSLIKYNWCLCDNGYQRYARRAYYDIDKGIKTEAMHRAIMKPPLGKVIDHRNSEGLDNRSDNLRLATHSENCCNRRKTRSKTSSRYLGVHFHHKKWSAYIKHSGKKWFLGGFVNEIDAAKAYDAAAKKYHGEFARLNFDQKPVKHILPMPK